VDAKKLAGIGALILSTKPKGKEKDEEPTEESEDEDMAQVSLDAMRSFMASVKEDNAEEALEHLKHLVQLCSSEDSY
jgi:hypothetical protein